MPAGHNLVQQHMELRAKALRWAEKAVKYEEAGRTREAAAAKKKATDWLKKARAIEERVKLKAPTGRGT